jgi:hypothetical protein
MSKQPGFLDGNTPRKKKHGFSWFTKILPHRHNGGDWDPLRGSIYVGALCQDSVVKTDGEEHHQCEHVNVYS